MVKYRLQYQNVEGDEFICDISNDAYTGDVIDVKGFCVLERLEIKELYTVVRGTGMRITLEADESLTLEDLYTEDEKTFSVKLTRNTVVLFRGFIDPAGLSEDLVNSVWNVNIDCVDGLALLDNLSYVDELGARYFGKESDIQVITNCLRRTGVTQDNGNQLRVLSSLNTRYTFLVRDIDPLSTTHSNQERFIKDDSNTVMSCKEVLESTLRKYGGSIVMDGDKWQIFSFYELLHTPSRWFYEYEDGALQSSSETNYTTLEIGSDINGFSNHWVNENQRKEIIPAVGAVKVSYKYGFVNSITDNPYFTNNGTTVDNWSILDGTYLTLGDNSISIETDPSRTTVIESDVSSVSADDLLVFKFVYNFPFPPSPVLLFFSFKVVLTDGATTYYLKNGNTWTTSDTFYEVQNGGIYDSGFFTAEIEALPLPISGDIKIILLRSRAVGSTTAIEYNRDLQITEVSAFAKTDENIKGENHIQQILGNSTRVSPVIDIFVGDNFSDVYEGALYKADEITNTDSWNTVFTPLDIENPQPILQILSEYIARHRRQPTYKLIGDIYGYFSYLQIFELSLIPNTKFMISQYSYNTYTNIVSSQFMELKTGATFGLAYSVALDYGNTVKPTIIG